MDHSTLLKEIVNETLSNDAAILELYDRRNHYAAYDLSQARHAKIAHLFETAVLDAKEAVAAQKPAVKVLKKVLLDLGRLLKTEGRVSHDKAKEQAFPKTGAVSGKTIPEVEHEPFACSTAHVSRPQRLSMKKTSQLQHTQLPSASGEELVSISGYRRPLTTSQAVGTVAVTGTKHITDKQDVPACTETSRLQQIQIHLEARNPGCSQEKVQKTASDHLVQILAKQRENAKNGAVRLSSTQNTSNVDATGVFVDDFQQSQADLQGSDDACRLPPSRSLSPSDPLSSMATSTSTSIAASSAAASGSGFAPGKSKRLPGFHPKAPAPKRRNTAVKEKKCALKEDGKKYKSEEFVVDSDDSDTEMKGFDTSAPSEVDPSEGLAGFTNLDDNGNYQKKPHARYLIVNGKVKTALVVKIKVSPEKLLDALYGKKDKAEGQPRNESSSIMSDTPHTDSGLTPSPFVPQIVPGTVSNDNDAVWESESDSDFETTAMTAPQLPSAVDFAGFPTLTAAHLTPFMKGLAIAIENISSDHTEKPDSSLLELVEHLEKHRPTLPAGTVAGDERHMVMSGGEYVYAAAHQIYADTALSKDSPKGSGVDPDGDTTMASTSSEDVYADLDQIDDVKLTDRYNGVTALSEKAQYKGKGRAWKKTPGDADPAFRALNKAKTLHLPKSELSRRKTTRSGRAGTWKEQGVEELFGAFRAHVKREYWFQAGHMGIQPDKEILPEWLWER